MPWYVSTLCRAGTLALAMAVAPSLAGPVQGQEAEVDALFARWALPNSPGCAVGVDREGAALIRAAYGQADLEWGIANEPATIFENGSVSKQFTAAAIVLLALDGALSLDDDLRSYIPELPSYAESITLRHMLNHTSGLRDWGSVAGLTGVGRTVRTHDQEHALQILARQSALNFEPGHEYSYSNSGYNLLAIIVSRVSGMPFAQFSRERIFEPLGMEQTQWRDDYTRIVPGRSAAYTANPDGSFSINRPIENVHGNGGLLTTVGDLLLWNRSLDEGRLAGREFVEMMETQGVLNDGRTIDYALGLSVGRNFGLRSVSHGGATSGYRAGLVRFPEPRVGVAVLCNVTNANALGLAMDVAEIYLGDARQTPAETPVPAGRAVSASALEALEGRYASTIRPAFSLLSVDDEGRLRMGGPNGDVMVARSESEFDLVDGGGLRVVFEHRGEGRPAFEIRYENSLVDAFVPAGEWQPTAEALQDYTGHFESRDASLTLGFVVDDGSLHVVHPLLGQAPLSPLYEDAFRLGGRILRFHRLTGGQVQEVSVAESRIYDMRFSRVH